MVNRSFATQPNFCKISVLVLNEEIYNIEKKKNIYIYNMLVLNFEMRNSSTEFIILSNTL